ncbi:MAG: putative sugar O-methyltransferase [Rhodospirillales bacterium]|nr:putative sugar O-methyltransferase [Rhodospirillales bacterium]
MIKHDPALFECIYQDTKQHFQKDYGDLWKGRVKASEYAIRHFPNDLKHFRSNMAISRGYTDSFCLDPLFALPLGKLKMRIFYRLAHSALGQKVLSYSRHECERVYKQGAFYKDYYYDHFYGDVLRNMVRRLPKDFDTLEGGSNDYAVIDGRRISIRHIYTLLRLYDLEQNLDLSTVSRVVEVGGGFGVNADCMLALYPHIKKYVIVDIPPCLYTATIYLRSRYGDIVRDYRQLKDNTQIDIGSDGKEVMTLPPWKMDDVCGNADLFVNLFSFQVFDADVLKSYRDFAQKLLANKNGAIWLGGYEVPASLTQEQILEAFSDVVTFNSVKHTERNKHGDSTWFTLGRAAHDT